MSCRARLLGALAGALLGGYAGSSYSYGRGEWAELVVTVPLGMLVGAAIGYAFGPVIL